jgi:phosphatidate cytidylyltransferase
MGDIRDNAPAGRGINWQSNWIRRPVVGIALIMIVLAALFSGRQYFASLLVFMTVTASREWHRMVGEGRYLPEAFVTAGTIIIALAFLVVYQNPQLAWIILLGGTGLSLIVSGLRNAHALWQSAGVLYIGIPSLAMASLYMYSPHGAWVMIGLFISVWATDTGALFVGKLVGGPKLAPVLSPNKTWAGTLGGVAVAAIAQSIYIGVLGGNIGLAALYGAGIAVVSHSGDLFESWTKRQFRVKDSGSLIPGHGGILDRVDSTLAAGSVAAFVILILGLDPLFGATL